MAVQPKGLTGKRLTILSIDGGGVRGVISAIMLAELESKLQDLDGAERRLLDYFDLVAGTSTGGLITAMITTPSTKDPTRSLFTAKGVTDLYINIAATIFPLIKGPCGQLWTTIASLLGPKYKPKGLEKLLHDNLGGDLLLNALLSVIIPSFDMKLQQPVFFSSWQAKQDPLHNAPMKLMCQATTAAPTYFPPVQFTLQDMQVHPPRIREFNMIDGGLAVNNPDFCNLLVLSLGTGQHQLGYSASDAAWRTAVQWVLKQGW